METFVWETEVQEGLMIKSNLFSGQSTVFNPANHNHKAGFQNWNNSATGQKLIDLLKMFKQCNVDKWKIIFNAYPQNYDRLFQSMMWGIGEQFWQTGYRTVIGV